MSAVQIERLSFSYGRRRVLYDLTWDVSAGVTGLIGPNGAGKSTLIRCLTGLARPSSGSIHIAGEDAADGGVRRIGYVPQDSRAPARMKVVDIIEYCAWLNGVPGPACPARAGDAIELLDLGPLSSRRFGTLSGGERRRVMLAAGLAHQPTVLVLDEPTVGLDPGQRLAVRRAVASLQGVDTVLLATHLVEDVEYLCSNVAILHHGRITYSGTTTGLLEHVQARADPEHEAFGSPFEQAYEALLEGDPPEDPPDGGVP